MQVADAMTPESELVTDELPGSRDDVLADLQTHGFSSVPVVERTDDEELYRGLVTRDDLIENPDVDQLAMLMREVPTTTGATDIVDAAGLMLAEGARRVPVVAPDDGTQLRGIVTVTDVVHAIAREQVDGDTPVGEVATPDVNATYHDAPLPVAEREIGHANVPYTVVLDDDAEMAGILTEVDIVEVARVVEGEDDTGASIATQDDEWMWEGIKAVGNRYLPTRDVQIPGEPAAKFMTEELVTVTKGRTATEAAQEMITNDVEQIPLLAGGNLAGVVRDVNLLEALHG